MTRDFWRLLIIKFVTRKTVFNANPSQRIDSLNDYSSDLALHLHYQKKKKLTEPKLLSFYAPTLPHNPHWQAPANILVRCDMQVAATVASIGGYAAF